MKRFIAVLSGLLVLPAFAEVAPVYYDEIVEYTDEMLDESDIQDDEVVEEKVQQPKVVQRAVAGRGVSRVTSAGNNNTNSRAGSGSRAVASSPRNAQQTTRGTVSRTAKTQSTATRTAVVSRSRATTSRNTPTVSARNASTNSNSTKARVSATGDVIPGVRNNVNGSSSKTLTDSGDPLYISARAGVSTRRASARNASAALGSAPVITSEDITETTSTLTNLAELTDYCKAQYAQCMDNYCNVLDENQGRCSCSANIKSYEKTEQALAAVTESFQDVVQKIKYIGLTNAQIEALFAETEAEVAMKSNSDSSQLKSSLDAIKKKIIDVNSANKSSNGLTDSLSFDMSGLLDTDFSSTFDLNSFLGTGTKVNSQRGTALFNTATQRCKTAVLNSCVNQGIDANVITNSYDLAIDKQCIEYERSLNEANTEMRNNVRNAQSILQQARLLLAQKKNAYDLRGCVAALDECMQDEYVCGDEYELCLDPTGKYLAKGAVVKGGTPGVSGGSVVNQENIEPSTMISWISGGMYGVYSTWNYGDGCKTLPSGASTCQNAWGGGTGENLNAYINEKVIAWNKEKTYEYKNWAKTPDDMATYLLRRVGYIDTKEDKSYGMCADVMKQCQDYTFDTGKSNKKYLPDNEVVRQYLTLAATKIKLKQDTILADYAETCWTDVYSCLATNSFDEENPTSVASRTAVNACRGDVATCMSVTGFHPSDNDTLTLTTMTDWVASKLLSCGENEYITWETYPDPAPGSGSTAPRTLSKVECKVCPLALCGGEDSAAPCTSTDGNYYLNTISSGGQVTKCSCPEGFSKILPSDTDLTIIPENDSNFERSFVCERNPS